jgi:hypothetical protein
MKPRFTPNQPLPTADLTMTVAFNIMANHVVTMCREFQERVDISDPEAMMPADRKEHVILSDLWANVRLNALFLLKQYDNGGK